MCWQYVTFKYLFYSIQCSLLKPPKKEKLSCMAARNNITILFIQREISSFWQNNSATDCQFNLSSAVVVSVFVTEGEKRIICYSDKRGHSDYLRDLPNVAFNCNVIVRDLFRKNKWINGFACCNYLAKIVSWKYRRKIIKIINYHSSAKE